MSAPGETAEPALSRHAARPVSSDDAEAPTLNTAVVIDQWDLYRFGVEQVLRDLDVDVQASTVRAAEGLRIARERAVDLLIVGRHADLKPQYALREAKRHLPTTAVMLLLEQAESNDVARLLSLGADALLLRSVRRDELADAIVRLRAGERVVASALAVGTLGRVGPAMELDEESAHVRTGLSPKELEVLAVLAEGLTYAQMASELLVSQATVKTHLVHIYAKLGVKNRADAIARALSLGLLA